MSGWRTADPAIVAKEQAKIVKALSSPLPFGEVVLESMVPAPKCRLILKKLEREGRARTTGIHGKWYLLPPKESATP